MLTSNIKTNINLNLRNIPGWRTNRKIVVFESDDWGSIRMSSRRAYDEMMKVGLPLDKSHYNKFDSLESNDDLELLMQSLQKFKDKSGRPPVFTGVNIVANPDFNKIEGTNFTEYHCEPFTETLKKYPAHDNVYALWKQAISKRLIVPIFHGREHLNVIHWLQALQSGNQTTRLAFIYGVTGVPRKGLNGEKVPEFQAAFNVQDTSEIEYHKEVLETGLDLFEEIFGYRSEYFVPTNGPFNNSLEKVLHENRVRYINTGMKQLEPLGNDRFKTNIRFLGQANQYGQRYITRNCFFEPSSSGFEIPKNTDWVDNCLKKIKIAFRWRKPAVISSHRVNYVGFLQPENRKKSLVQLEVLLGKIIKTWPDAEFLTSVELGQLIANDR